MIRLSQSLRKEGSRCVISGSQHKSRRCIASSIHITNLPHTYQQRGLHHNAPIEKSEMFCSRFQIQMKNNRIFCCQGAQRYSSAMAEKELSIEEQYSRKTPLEHILLRPGMYVGPVDKSQPSPCWVPHPLPPLPPKNLIPGNSIYNSNSEVSSMLPLEKLPMHGKTQMIQKKIACYPALVKVFDEILVNAFDNRLRYDPKQSTTQIDVIIHPGTPSSRGKQSTPPYISITNNGKGIPVQIHKQENMYLPEMLFGHLLTGSNFDDSNQKKLTGGRHGYGAKLTNIFSKEFELETLDMVRKKQYNQKWEENMKIVHKADIKDVNGKDGGYTRVCFVPDLEKLTKDNDAKQIIPEEDYAIMCRRVFDVAGCAGGKVTVTLNGQVLPVESFQDYALMYRKQSEEKEGNDLRFQRLNARWEIGVGLSDSGSFESMSFVNGMDTVRGGTHVNAVVQQVTKKISDKIAKDYPELAGTATQALVRRHLSIFVNTLIENPTFDSQMKESLTSSPSTFGSRYTLTDKFLNELVADENSGGPGIIDQVVRSARGRQQAALLRHVGGTKKTRRQLLNIPKLDDAHMAGSEKSSNCSLILTEGDSAKALAVAGLEIIGREHHGVFPLRGKFLNVRDATVTQLTNNQEVKALCMILGLDFEKTYETQSERDELRYGHIMLMTDQDADGSHIKGLVMNFFRHFWPSLLMPAVDSPEKKPFLSSFITPLIKATKKKGAKRDTKTFYSMAEYNSWRSELPEDGINQWNIKYYKGLGTSTPAEAKEYFRDFVNHHRSFKWESDEDGLLLDMVFEKDRSNERKEWLKQYDETLILYDPSAEETAVSYENFINKEMIHFSNADNIRSIPSAIDGLKPSQRKVLYACFKRNLKNEIKVAQLTGYVAEHSAYHHGEASLHSTIIGMAQDFVGSNNINLLEPSGQFGTRLAGGKDAASPRYIFTRLSPVTRLLFPDVDGPLLHHLEDDGVIIEPKFYCPILPLLIINGAQGIGTGWSTFIPQHDVRDVLQYVRAKLNEEDSLPEIRPWTRGFTGKIELKEDKSGYRTLGQANKKSRTSVIISELPVGKWTNDYKNHLLRMQSKGEIDSFVENHTTTTVSFNVSMKAVQLNRMMQSGLDKAFKLDGHMPLTNMHAFDSNMRIRKYEFPEEIVNDYFPIRLGLYHDRKEAIECSKEYSAELIRSKAKFIENVVDGSLDLVRGNKSKKDTVHQLEELEFAPMGTLENIMTRSRASTRLDLGSASDNVEDELSLSEGDELKQYDYLLNMPLSSLTVERIQSLQDEANKTEKELASIRDATAEDLWHGDLDKLDEYLHKKMKH